MTAKQQTIRRSNSLLMLARATPKARPTSSVQALVQYPDGVSATNAMNALEGHAIYDGGYNKVTHSGSSCPWIAGGIAEFELQIACENSMLSST